MTCFVIWDRIAHMENNNATPILWKASDVAAFLQVSRGQVYRLIDDEALPHVRVSERTIRFDPETVKQWALSRQGSGPQRANGAGQ